MGWLGVVWDFTTLNALQRSDFQSSDPGRNVAYVGVQPSVNTSSHRILTILLAF